MKETLNNQASKSIVIRVIIKFLHLILTLNNFIFDGINYLQVKGCAMRTICAPAYANIFMGKFEKPHIYSYIRNIWAFHCRFIDNIFFLWNGKESELIEFKGSLNIKQTIIKPEFTHSKTSITFLDTKIYKNQNEILYTTMYYVKEIK